MEIVRRSCRIAGAPPMPLRRVQLTRAHLSTPTFPIQDSRGVGEASLAIALGEGAASLSQGTEDEGYDAEGVRRRAIGAVLGALVADAATMGLHVSYRATNDTG